MLVNLNFCPVPELEWNPQWVLSRYEIRAVPSRDSYWTRQRIEIYLKQALRQYIIYKSISIREKARTLGPGYNHPSSTTRIAGYTNLTSSRSIIVAKSAVIMLDILISENSTKRKPDLPTSGAWPSVYPVFLLLHLLLLLLLLCIPDYPRIYSLHSHIPSSHPSPTLHLPVLHLHLYRNSSLNPVTSCSNTWCCLRYPRTFWFFFFSTF